MVRKLSRKRLQNALHITLWKLNNHSLRTAVFMASSRRNTTKNFSYCCVTIFPCRRHEKVESKFGPYFFVSATRKNRDAKISKLFCRGPSKIGSKIDKLVQNYGLRVKIRMFTKLEIDCLDLHNIWWTLVHRFLAVVSKSQAGGIQRKTDNWVRNY